MNSDSIKPEDYIEPVCVLCEPAYGQEIPVRTVPQQRIIEKMDEYMSRRDYAGAERHLLYWLEEAQLGNDLGGELMLRNELVGHYRKTGNREQALVHIQKALELVCDLGFEGTVSAGTTYTNCGTALNAFGENEQSLALFEKARQAYESSDRVRTDLMGGLYNNMALTCAALKRFDEARAYYAKAMNMMKQTEYGELEQAITCLNLANLIEAEQGLEAGEHEIFDLLDQAYDLLKTEGIPRDGYYAFVLEKCAPTFGYYGYFAAAQELKETSEKIYAGH